jgi:hypothetical protein
LCALVKNHHEKMCVQVKDDHKKYVLVKDDHEKM